MGVQLSSVLGQWLIYLLYLVLLIGVLLVVYYLYQKLNSLYTTIHAYLQAANQIRIADSAQACKYALMIIARAESWPENLSLLQWQQRWNQQHPELITISGPLQKLQESLYSNKTDRDINTILNSLLETFYRRLPLLRWLMKMQTGK